LILRAVCAALVLACAAPVASPARSEPAAIAPEVMDRIWQVMDMDGALAVMRDEGLAVSADVAETYLPARRGRGWEQAVAEIYDPARMHTLVRDAFAADFAGADAAPVIDFFGGDIGQRIIALELSARRAFLDEDTEAAARDRLHDGSVPERRAELIDRFIEVNDLIAFNTSGALNTNFAFLSGLATAPLFEMSEADILARVYGDAEETSADTAEWLRAYLTMAYQPLSDAELEAYIAFSDRPAGRRVNRALFAGFGKMYDRQYHALGLAVAQQLSGQDL
jgi:hypothetical protein